MENKKLAKSAYVYNYSPALTQDPGLTYDLYGYKRRPYHESIRLCRYFYQQDPIANTVVNRIAEISNTRLRNRRKSLLENGSVNDREYNFYNAVARIIQPFVENIILSYLIDGMAVPQYELTRAMGNRIDLNLGRTRYTIPTEFWLRNPEHIKLYKTVSGNKRSVLLTVPQEDINFITSGGMRSDGVMDRQAYNQLEQEFPEYVQAIKDGATTFPLTDYVIYRKMLAYNDYPIPFLEAALDPLDHKRYLKMLDRATASRAIESFRHVRIGNDEYPADDDDITDIQEKMDQKSSVERVYNFFTHHAVDIQWVTPPLETLLNDAKYDSANQEIFFALGFPRILTVGETEKSNSADNKIAGLGVLSTLHAIQKDVLGWVRHVYAEIAEENGITKIPEPYFSQIPISDVTTLIQYLRDMLENRVVSKDTAAGFYGVDYESETEQIEYEQENAPKAAPEEIIVVEENNSPQGTENNENT